MPGVCICTVTTKSKMFIQIHVLTGLLIVSNEAVNGNGSKSCMNNVSFQVIYLLIYLHLIGLLQFVNSFLSFLAFGFGDLFKM